VFAWRMHDNGKRMSMCVRGNCTEVVVHLHRVVPLAKQACALAIDGARVLAADRFGSVCAVDLQGQLHTVSPDAVQEDDTGVDDGYGKMAVYGCCLLLGHCSLLTG
jgi:hypothetical protein